MSWKIFEIALGESVGVLYLILILLSFFQHPCVSDLDIDAVDLVKSFLTLSKINVSCFQLPRDRYLLSSKTRILALRSPEQLP